MPSIKTNNNSPQYFSSKRNCLRNFSYLTCFSTFLLIYVGGLVKSTESGLAVPDWPLSYGMLFPPMVGGVFYEHSHRLVAAFVGLLTLVLAILLSLNENRRWVKILGWSAFGAVGLQGVLGGLTVLFFLPTSISVAHGILAQTFFVLTIIIAYSQSRERFNRQIQENNNVEPNFLRLIILLILLIYFQLTAGAVMRHTESGLAIPDFPTMGGQWLPLFNEKMLAHINDWRFENNFDPATLKQVILHSLHRFGAMVLLVAIGFLNFSGIRHIKERRVLHSLYLLDGIFVLQITLGIFSVLTIKEPQVTSVHVAVGAAVLGISMLLFLQAAPISYSTLKRHF